MSRLHSLPRLKIGLLNNARNFDPDVVLFHVGAGDEAKVFHVVKFKVVSKSPVLKAVLDKAGNSFIHLPHDNPESFGQLIKWVTQGTVPQFINQHNKYASVVVPEDGDFNAFTADQVKRVKKEFVNALKTKAGQEYKAPAVDLYPTLAAKYKAVISNPIDLGTMQTKLCEGRYRSITQFEDDLDLLYSNSAQFDGVEHYVTKLASELRDRFKSVLQTKVSRPAPKKPRRNTAATTTARDTVTHTIADTDRDTIISLFLVAEKYGVAELADLVMDYFLETNRKTNFHPGEYLVVVLL